MTASSPRNFRSKFSVRRTSHPDRSLSGERELILPSYNLLLTLFRVHDENAWALNGVSGHAGIFSTAYDLSIFCQMILNNGSYHGVKVLEPWTVDLIFTNYNTACQLSPLRISSLLTPAVPDDAHGLGFELNQTYWSGSMRSLQNAGHTGFTGTTLWVDRSTATFGLHLTNRVHPSRQWSSTNIAREYLGYFVAKALGRNPSGPTATG